MPESRIIIVDVVNNKYLSELKGDPFYVSDIEQAKIFSTYKEAYEYKSQHKIPVRYGRILRYAFPARAHA